MVPLVLEVVLLLQLCVQQLVSFPLFERLMLRLGCLCLVLVVLPPWFLRFVVLLGAVVFLVLPPMWMLVLQNDLLGLLFPVVVEVDSS